LFALVENLMDWDKCVICQKHTKDDLQCPANSKRNDGDAGYASFSNNVLEFKSIDAIPLTGLNIALLDEGQGIEETLRQRKAVWHKKCRDIFNNTKLERAKKRKLSCDQPETNEDGNVCELTYSPIKARRLSNPLPSTKAVSCFFPQIFIHFLRLM